MFKIADGREHFYQWDLNRQIAVEDAAITELHFCNKTDDCSLVVEVVDGLANVPNILLQSAWDVRVYAYCSDYTKVEKRFKVVARSKPSGYVYTETEVKSYAAIEAKVATVEQTINKIGNSISTLQTAVGEINKTAQNAESLANTAQTTAETAQQTANSAGQAAYGVKQIIHNEIQPTLTTLETAVGDMETAVNAILDIQRELIGEITFTIKELGGDISYTAVKGMTWQEWCNSTFNTSNRYRVENDRVLYSTSTKTYAVGTKATQPVMVLATDKIVDGAAYRADLTLEGVVSDGD